MGDNCGGTDVYASNQPSVDNAPGAFQTKGFVSHPHQQDSHPEFSFDFQPPIHYGHYPHATGLVPDVPTSGFIGGYHPLTSVSGATTVNPNAMQSFTLDAAPLSHASTCAYQSTPHPPSYADIYSGYSHVSAATASREREDDDDESDDEDDMMPNPTQSPASHVGHKDPKSTGQVKGEICLWSNLKFMHFSP